MRVAKIGLKEKQIFCPHCDSELYYNSMDIEKRILPPFVSTPFINYIVCPICKKEIILPEKS